MDYFVTRNWRTKTWICPGKVTVTTSLFTKGPWDFSFLEPTWEWDGSPRSRLSWRKTLVLEDSTLIRRKEGESTEWKTEVDPLSLVLTVITRMGKRKKDSSESSKRGNKRLTERIEPDPNQTDTGLSVTSEGRHDPSHESSGPPGSNERQKTRSSFVFWWGDGRWQYGMLMCTDWDLMIVNRSLNWRGWDYIIYTGVELWQVNCNYIEHFIIDCKKS